jgi:hypothetical protein
MELTTELFDQIVNALGAADQARAAGRDADNRRAARLNLAAQVQMVRHGVTTAQPRTVKLLSLSRSGAAVLDWGTMQAGEKVILHLPRGGGGTVPVVCMVKNTRLSGAEFRLGVQFLSANEQTGAPVLRGVDGIVNKPVHAGQVDVLDVIAAKGVDPTKAGREHRVELNVQGLLSNFCNGQAGPMHFVTVKDISPGGGVCVIQPAEMTKGERFVLQVPRQNGAPLTMLGTVVDCKCLDDTNFRIGARFETKLIDQHADAPPKGLLNKLRRWLAA